MPLEPVKTVRENLRVASKRRRGSVLTGIINGLVEIGRMQTAQQQNKFWRKPERADVSGSDLAGRVAVDATLPVVLAGDVAVGATSMVAFTGSASQMWCFRPLMKGHPPLADCVGMTSPTIVPRCFPCIPLCFPCIHCLGPSRGPETPPEVGQLTPSWVDDPGQCPPSASDSQFNCPSSNCNAPVVSFPWILP